VDNRPQCEKESRVRIKELVAYWSNYEIKKVYASGEEKEDSPEMSLVPQQGEVESRMTLIWIAGPVVLEQMIRGNDTSCQVASAARVLGPYPTPRCLAYCSGYFINGSNTVSMVREHSIRKKHADVWM